MAGCSPCAIVAAVPRNYWSTACEFLESMRARQISLPKGHDPETLKVCELLDKFRGELKFEQWRKKPRQARKFLKKQKGFPSALLLPVLQEMHARGVKLNYQHFLAGLGRCANDFTETEALLQLMRSAEVDPNEDFLRKATGLGLPPPPPPPHRPWYPRPSSLGSLPPRPLVWVWLGG